MTKRELATQLNTICDEILKEIIEPICDIRGSVSDYWLADISTYTMDDEGLNQQILCDIQEKYRLTEHEMVDLDSFTTLMQMALFIYLRDLDSN